jgi:hypothetical protein
MISTLERSMQLLVKSGLQGMTVDNITSASCTFHRQV